MDFTHLFPIYRVYVDNTICESQGMISFFLIVDGGIYTDVSMWGSYYGLAKGEN